MKTLMHTTEQLPDKARENAVSVGASPKKPFLDRLETLYAHMDRRYQDVAETYGFHCQGCKDNCCRSTFYHHTLVETLYLEAGIQTLGKDLQVQILHLAQTVAARPSAGLFCPLNQEGRCLLYAHRPMICRLHGLAHEVHRPDGTVSHGPGCAAFEAFAKGKPQIAFDRTEFYWALSKLEQEARAALGGAGKIKLTVSQMLTACPGDGPGEGDSPHEKY